MEVRPATPFDLEAVAEVHVRSWQETYPRQVPQDYLDSLSVEQGQRVWASSYDDTSGHVAILVLVDEGAVVGFTHVRASRDADAPVDVGEVTSMYLRRSHWGRGGGRALMAGARHALSERGFAEATLWVLDTNARARRFYETNGWVLDGAEKRDSIGGMQVKEVRYRRPLT